MVTKFLLNTKEKIETFLLKIEVQNLFITLLVIFGSILICVFLFSRYSAVYSAIYQERLEKLNYVANFAKEVLDGENRDVLNHTKTLKEAQDSAMQILSDVRFEDNDYIWITRYDGKIISHPNPNFLNTNLSVYSDNKGNNFGLKMVELPKIYGTAYINYDWPKPHLNKVKSFHKVSYLLKYKEWEWIIGTGLYIDDIQVNALRAMFKSIYPIIIGSFLAMFLFRYILWVTVVNPIKELSEKSLKLANGDLNVTISNKNLNTEFGKLYNAFDKFVSVFKEKKANEEKLSLILDNITDVLITIDKIGIIQTVNPTIEKMFGYNQNEIIGKHVNLLTSPTIFSDNTDLIQKLAYKSGKYEILGIKKNEEIFPIEVNINDILYHEEPLSILLIRDISEQKEVDRMKNDFISVVSHELRTPLTSIRGSLGLLLSGSFPTIEGKIKNLIELAHNNCLRLIDLINDILDIEKIAAGKLEFNYEKVDATEIMNDIINLNKPYADKFNVKYVFRNMLTKDVFLRVDKQRFGQVLTNLLSNSSKFSPENSSVIIGAELIGDYVQISVKDSGKGVPEDFKHKIFNKFTQADSSDSRQKGGTGLGLSICKSLVEEMNGEISYESTLDVGTTFYIKLPVYNS